MTEKFVEYLAYKATYEKVQPNEEIPDFIERIAPEIALELCVFLLHDRVLVRMMSACTSLIGSLLVCLSLTILRVRSWN